MDTPDGPYRLAEDAAATLVERLGPHPVALVLGSGWASAADGIGTVLGELAAHELPGVPRPSVTGHAGVVRSLEVANTRGTTIRALVVAGRSHLYEGHPVETVVHGVRSAVLAGSTTVVLTNAAGAVRTDLRIGEPVLISDQLNLTGTNPMVGDDPPPGRPSRFVDLSDLYDAGLRRRIRSRAPDLSQGVYAGLLGGSFETPAEIRMLGTAGADLVGMSTVLEAIAARHLGAEVIGLSLVTNMAAGLQGSIDHLDVLAAAADATPALRSTLVAVLDAVAER